MFMKQELGKKIKYTMNGNKLETVRKGEKPECFSQSWDDRKKLVQYGNENCKCTYSFVMKIGKY